MKESLFQRFEDEYGSCVTCKGSYFKGNIDFRRSSGMSKSKEVNRFLAALQRVSEQNSTSLFTMQVSFVWFWSHTCSNCIKLQKKLVCRPIILRILLRAWTSKTTYWRKAHGLSNWWCPTTGDMSTIQSHRFNFAHLTFARVFWEFFGLIFYWIFCFGRWRCWWDAPPLQGFMLTPPTRRIVANCTPGGLGLRSNWCARNIPGTSPHHRIDTCT